MPSFIRTANLVGESLSANLVGGTCSTLTSLFHNTSQPAYLEGADTRARATAISLEGVLAPPIGTAHLSSEKPQENFINSHSSLATRKATPG
ncbi:hypothetical protein QVD17_38135 [Tagetes erecta]|uniref:Uncharacterized protein n=1 Tax=Tagetes erecta TaxID=13708 RepID=A0AAD8JX77_TARER|nr:hypothetical protein QVD17_38135 [Tagetes erecta]